LENQIVGIRSVDISADGKRAIAGFAGGELAIWDLTTGGQICIMQGHANIVNDVKFTPDGNHAISGSNDHNVLLWDIENCDHRDLPTQLYSHQSWVMSVDTSADGKLVASGSSDQSIIIWDLVTARQLYRLQLPDSGSIPGIDGFVLSVSFSPDGRLIAASYANGSTAVWSVTDGILLRRFISPPEASCIYGTRCFWVWDVVFSPNTDELVTGSADGILRTWPMIPTGDLVKLRAWVVENRFIRPLTGEEKGAYGIDEKK
jgi:WD40 repeat protein